METGTTRVLCGYYLFDLFRDVSVANGAISVKWDQLPHGSV